MKNIAILLKYLAIIFLFLVGGFASSAEEICKERPEETNKIDWPRALTYAGNATFGAALVILLALTVESVCKKK